MSTASGCESPVPLDAAEDGWARRLDYWWYVFPAGIDMEVSGIARDEPEAVNQHVRAYGPTDPFYTRRGGDFEARKHYAGVHDWLAERHRHARAYVVLDALEWTVRLETHSRDVVDRYVARVGGKCAVATFGPPPRVHRVDPEPWSTEREYAIDPGLPEDALCPRAAADLHAELHYAVDIEHNLVHAVSYDADTLRQEFPALTIGHRKFVAAVDAPPPAPPPPATSVDPGPDIDWARVQTVIREHYAEIRAQCHGMPWALVDPDGITVRCTGSSLGDVCDRMPGVAGMVVCVAPETPGASLGLECVSFRETR